MYINKKLTIIEESLNKKFNKLTVEKFVEFRKTPKGANVPIVSCRCECGKTKEVSLWDIRSGKTKTCAFNHPHYEDRSLPAFNSLYNNTYKNRAIKAGLDFAITRNEFREITQLPCHYCGCFPENVSYRGKRGTKQSGKYVSQYVYNGLDRKDSSKGYVLENIVPCCGICNHAKHTMSYNNFINWLNRVTEFRNTQKQIN